MSVEEKHVAKKMAMALAFMCMKDYFRQPLKERTSFSGEDDCAGVFIATAKGKKVLHCQKCHLSVMEDIADGIYDFLLNIETEAYARKLEDAYHASVHWKKAHTSKNRKKKH